MMFSVLSQGYGTYDGTAKKDVQEISDTKVSLNTSEAVGYALLACCNLSRFVITIVDVLVTLLPESI